MKIAIFTDTFLPDVNGVAKTLGRLTTYLDSSNHHYIVISPKQTRNESATDQIYPQSSFPFPLYKECRISLPKKTEIKNLLLSFEPDIIHVATPFSIGLCGLQLAKKLNIPLVGSYHTDFDHYLHYYHLSLLSRPLWRYMEWFHQSMSRIFVPSAHTFSQLQKRDFHNIQIWKRGVDTTVFHPHYNHSEIRKKYNIKQKYILSYVGRLAPEKNIETLAYLFKNLPEQLNRQIHWSIIGDGPSKQYLEEHKTANVTITGFLSQKEVAPFLASSDLFVFPSESETFGNVVLEALACGTPVAGANAGGVKTIIQEGFTGMLCRQGKKDDYINAIASILENSIWRQQLEENAVRYAQKQRWEDQFEDLLTGYQEVINEERKTTKHA
ncbi:glycosyltransferase family 1 protein [Gracilibacillus oryzae]|uniref:Glycosyltransferase family 1 protein n=1 Tax=Gracilibacillus oryzae TaxID=1672701 RepID=A0A7C8GSS7_9BACI|nr:glycosyltransferase family 1 protein [Gracilibacillus oryzae]KAB8131770.1 glycosyltransferase family 1 protein [Gracilibacillus oryzae]